MLRRGALNRGYPPASSRWLPGIPAESPSWSRAHDARQTELGAVAFAYAPLGLVDPVVLRYQMIDIVFVPSVAGAEAIPLARGAAPAASLGVRSTEDAEGEAFATSRLRAGDDPRHIDWKASRASYRLISREYTIEQAQTVVSRSTPAVDDAARRRSRRFEYALHSALALADVAIAAGDRVGPLVFDAVVRR